jgi:NADH:quinone reductase (non-electrogenic)
VTQRAPVVVIVGGDFAGLSAAQALRNAPARVFLIDRTKHHLFQPLLYQVAISVLSPGQIASPLRAILNKQRNTTVLMAEVVGVHKEKKLVFASSPDRARVAVQYDFLSLATGAMHSYFGHHEFEKYPPGLKSLADAVAVRNKILQAFEQAEEDAHAHRDLLRSCW